ncbi:MAG: DUF4169 family protein [Pseudomonadota bacterium]
MADTPINLNKARKAKARAASKQAAEENRIKHGRSKAEKRAASDVKTRAAKRLDDKRLGKD